MNKPVILVTDASYKQTLGIVRQLGKDGFKTFVLSHYRFSLAGLSKYTREIVIKKNYDLQDFIDICEKHRINFLILVGTESFKKIVPWKKELEKKGIKMVTVDKDTLEIAFSKKQTYLIAERIEIPYPKTFYPKSLKDLDSVPLECPCVIKGLEEVGHHIVDYVYNKNDLKRKYIAICKKYNLSEKQFNLPMIQEYIEGLGCGFFAVYNKGKCGLTFQHLRIREWPVSGGASVCAESFKNKIVQEYGKKLLDYLKWHGVAMVEFKLSKRGIPILMEINPKFWGSTDLALEAGVNFPKALVDISMGKDIKYSDYYKIPFRYHWPFHGDFLHGIVNPRNLPSVIKDTFDPRVKSNVWLKDPLPILRMVWDFIRQLLKLILY